MFESPLVHTKADKKKNPVALFNATYEKCRGVEGIDDIAKDLRVAAVQQPVKWIKEVLAKVLGWRQTGALIETLQEVDDYVQKFKKAKEELAQEQGRISVCVCACVYLYGLIDH